MERLAKGHSLSRIYRALKPPISYGALTYHVRKDRERGEVMASVFELQPAKAVRPPAERGEPVAPAAAPAPIPAIDRLARLRAQAEAAGHHGRRAIYDPTANTHEDLFGPAKEDTDR